MLISLTMQHPSALRSRLSLSAAVLLLAGLSAAAEPARATDQRPAVGDPAPPLAVSDVDGVSHSLADSTVGPRILIFFRGAW